MNFEMTKKGLLIVVYSLFQLISCAQSPNWQWAHCSTGSQVAEGSEQSNCGIATDRNGNVYCIGTFTTVTIGLGDYILNRGGTIQQSNRYLPYNFFLVKYDSLGEMIWAKSAKISDTTYAVINPTGITTDDDGYVFITGNLLGGNVELDSVLFPAGSRYFVAKYASNGSLQWARADNGDLLSGQSIASDKAGNVYVAGQFSGLEKITFGSDTLVSNAYANGSSLFVTKYSPTGQNLWARTMTSVHPSQAEIFGAAISTDMTGNVYVSGTIKSTDTIIVGNYIFAGPVNVIYIIKYNTYGDIEWIRFSNNIGPISSQYGSNVEIHGMSGFRDNAVYVTGGFYCDSISFGPKILYRDSGASESFFLAKFDTSGTLIWSKSGSGGNSDIGYSVANDILGNIYLSGLLIGDSLIIDGDTLFKPINGKDNMFIAKFGEDGSLLCHATLASGGNYNSIKVDFTGGIYVGGTYGDQSPFIVGVDSLPQTLDYNFFIAKLNCHALATDNISLQENYILQLHPNPLTTQATVQYALPAGSKNATLIIYDILGREKSSYPLNNSDGELTLNANNLSSGIYLYSLVVDGRVLVTKKMVVEN